MSRENPDRFGAGGAQGGYANIPPTDYIRNDNDRTSDPVPPHIPVPSPQGDAGGKTRPISPSLECVEPGQVPVVGWLVVVSGEFKGRDYRLHPGYNHIGRDPYESHVCIDFDETVTKLKHAKLLYDDRGNKFSISHDSGVNPTRLNDEIVDARSELKAFDKILVGETELLFIPLCSETFKW